MEEGYMCFWREVNGKKVDETYLHFECEEDFLEAADKKGWLERYCEPMPEIYIDPVIAAWKRKKGL